MKTISKIGLVLMLILCTAMIMPQTKVFAEAVNVMPGVSIEANTAGETEAGSQMASVVNRLLGFLQVASALLAVVMIAATGFRYIMETPEMKNELKKSMIPIIVGILLVFFAASIAKFFIGIFAA